LPVPTARKIRFGAFELNRQTAELFKFGRKLKLQGQPIAVLSVLLDRPGELVTREELRKHLWPEDTFVDFEHSLNTHIKKLRQVFDDDAEKPRYIETLPRRGYRFLARVEEVPTDAPVIAQVASAANTVAVLEPPPPSVMIEPASLPQPEPPSKPHRRMFVIAALLVIAIAAGVVYWVYRPRTPVITGKHLLAQAGRREVVLGFHPVETDGKNVYFQEAAGDHARIGQVSVNGGEVSYFDTSPLKWPEIFDIAPDGSELILYDLSDQFGIVSFAFPLPHGPIRKIPGPGAAFLYLPASDRLIYQTENDHQLFTEKRDGTDVRKILRLPKEFFGNWPNYSFAVSPDGQRARFNNVGNQMWESAIDGSSQHRILIEHKGTMCCGIWSPDGKLFVFSSEDRERDNLWAITERGFPFYRLSSQPVRLTDGPISFRYATVSEDGKRIFARGETKRGELNVYDAESRKFRPYLNGISAGFTDFSRDGQWVTYVSHPDGALWRSRMDGSDPLKLTDTSLGRVINPKWSPDGRFIAFSTLDRDYNPKIYLSPADGGDPMLLVSGEFRPVGPTWSPDGNSIAYGGMGQTGAATEIRILNLVTKETRTIPGSIGMFAPLWSPDGRYIAAQSEKFKRLFIYTLKTNRWSELPVPHLATYEKIGWPAWSHDSRYLYAIASSGIAGSKIYRFSVPGGQPELVATAHEWDILCPVFPWDFWLGLTADDRPLVLRDTSIDEIYALDLKYR